MKSKHLWPGWVFFFLTLSWGYLLKAEPSGRQAREEAPSKKEPLLQPQSLDLLRQVSEIYSNLNSYHFEVSELAELKSEAGEKKVETRMEVAFSRPDKIRIIMKSPAGEVQSFSDGTFTLTYLPRLKQYVRRSVTAANEGADRKNKTPESALLSIAIQFPDRYKKILDGVEAARITSEESLTLDGISRDCAVVQVKTHSAPDPVESSSSRTYWIEKRSGLILKMISGGKDAMEAGGERIETTVTSIFHLARINQNLPESLFEFMPPEGAQEVAEFGQSRSLPGDEAGDFRLKALDGQEVQLKNLRGKVVLLNFWASWCGPCRLEMPFIEKLHHELKDKGLMVFGVNDEDVDTIRDYIKENGYSFPTLLDQDQEVLQLFRVRAIPTMIVIDKQGIIVSYRVGLSPQNELRASIRKAGIQ